MINYAHSLENQPPEKWQSLEEHAAQVAACAAGFANSFASDEWAKLAGLLHDLGKARKSLLAVGPKRDSMRRLQRNTVNIPRHTLMRLRDKALSKNPSRVCISGGYNLFVQRKFWAGCLS